MWDCAGKLSQLLCEAMPSLEVLEGSPSKVQLSSTESGFNVIFDPDSFLFRSAVHPKIKDGFASDCDKLANFILREFKIKVLNRIGNRIKFTKTFKDDADATRAIERFAISKGLTLELFSSPCDSLKKKRPERFRPYLRTTGEA